MLLRGKGNETQQGKGMKKYNKVQYRTYQSPASSGISCALTAFKNISFSKPKVSKTKEGLKNRGRKNIKRKINREGKRILKCQALCFQEDIQQIWTNPVLQKLRKQRACMAGYQTTCVANWSCMRKSLKTNALLRFIPIVNFDPWYF